MARPSKDENISLRIEALHQEHLHCYGKRRMQKSIEKEGVSIGTFNVARLIKEVGVVAKIPKKSHYYPAENEKPTIHHLLKRQFNPETLNTHWVGDITYIRNHQGWSYLATVLDLSTREIVGYAISTTPDDQLAKDALLNATSLMQPNTKKLMFHSD